MEHGLQGDTYGRCYYRGLLRGVSRRESSSEQRSSVQPRHRVANGVAALGAALREQPCESRGFQVGTVSDEFSWRSI